MEPGLPAQCPLDPQPWSMTISEHLVLIMAAQVAPVVENLPVNAGVQKTQVRSLGWEDPLVWEKAPHCSILAWKIP